MKQREKFQKHFNPIEYIQCPEFSTTPAVFISGTTSTVFCLLQSNTRYFVNHLERYAYHYIYTYIITESRQGDVFIINFLTYKDFIKTSPCLDSVIIDHNQHVEQTLKLCFFHHIFYLFRCVLSSMLPLRSIGRSNFVMVCVYKNLTTLIKKKRHILMRTAIYIYI